MKKQTYEEAVLKVVMWWSDKSFRTTENQNIGGETTQEQNVSLLLNMVSSKAKGQLTKEKITAFENKLTELLMNAVGHDRNLDVDYAPCNLLYESAKFAGIDSHCFPVKSSTWIDDNNRAYAKYQYGGSSVEI